MPASLSIMLLTRGEFDVRAALLECVYEAFADQALPEPEAAVVGRMVKVVWSRNLKIGDGRRLHRATFTPGIDYDEDGPDVLAVMTHFGDRVRKRVGVVDPGVVHVVQFASAAQVRHHERLYREIYEIEMRLREVLTYIFLDEFPDRPYEFLNGLSVRLEGDPNQHSAPYLAAHSENQLFQILFKSYLGLNNPPVASLNNLLVAVKDQVSYEGFRAAVSNVPIKKQSHQDFLALLGSFAPDIEAVRNAVAHNRNLPKNAEQKYNEARQKLESALVEFWTAEDGANGLPPAVRNSLAMLPPEPIALMPVVMQPPQTSGPPPLH